MLRTLSDCRVITLPKNQGKGAALRTGFLEATGDYVIVQDADLEYDPADIARLVQVVQETGAQVVYGSRRLGGTANPKAGLSYYIGGVFLSALTNLLYGTAITDEPTCYKMFERSLLLSLPLACTGFEFCPEVTANVALRGVPIVEVPISYHPRSRAEGKKIKLHDGLVAVRTLIGLRWPRLRL